MISAYQLPTADSQGTGARLRRRWESGIAAAVVAIALSGVAAQAHHSLSGMYDQSRRVTVDGVVAEFHYVNPHPYIVLEVKDARAGAQPWRLEMDNRVSS